MAALQNKAKSSELDEIDKSLLAELIRNPSITNETLSGIVGINRNAIAKRRKNPQFIRAYDEAVMSAVTLFQKYAPEFIRQHYRLAHSADENVAVRATSATLKHILPQKIEVDADVRHIAVLDLVEQLAEARVKKAIGHDEAVK